MPSSWSNTRTTIGANLMPPARAGTRPRHDTTKLSPHTGLRSFLATPVVPHDTRSRLSGGVVSKPSNTAYGSDVPNMPSLFLRPVAEAMVTAKPSEYGRT
jgi:hypothetical protein